MLMFFKKMRKSKKGFTLTELIVVVAILGVLAAVATPMVLGQVNNARVQADNANMKMLSDAYQRAAVGGTFTLPIASNTSKSTVQGYISSEVPTIPVPQVSNNVFYFNYTTGVVSSSAANGIQISP